MNKPSLALQSELVVAQLEAELTEHDEVWRLHTPSHPSFYFGNLLALKVPILSKPKAEWEALFASQFPANPEIKHKTFTWVNRQQETRSDLSDWLGDHYDFDETHILGMAPSGLKAIALNNSLKISAIESEGDWEQWQALAFLEKNDEHDKDELKAYLKGRADNYQALAKRSAGEYLGAFDGDRLVGYAGLYHRGEMARFQNVHVIPEYENQGIARTLLARLIERAPANIEQLIIVADEHYHASKLYQALGFQIVERERSLCWWPERARQRQGAG